MNNDDAAIQIYKEHGAEWMMKNSNPDHTIALINIIQSHLSNNDRILDICCGYGRLAIPLAYSGYKINGIDISDVLIKKARNLCEEKGLNKEIFTVANMKDLPFENNSFEFSFCVWASFNFLTSLDDQITALNEMFRTLKPGGMTLIECPYHETKEGLMKAKAGNVDYAYNPITLDDMKSLCELTSFTSYKVAIHSVANRNRMITILEK